MFHGGFSTDPWENPGKIWNPGHPASFAEIKAYDLQDGGPPF